MEGPWGAPNLSVAWLLNSLTMLCLKLLENDPFICFVLGMWWIVLQTQTQKFSNHLLFLIMQKKIYILTA